MPSLPDDVKALAERVRNWKRWGDDDELGTLNLLTDERVRDAAALVQSGRRIPMGIALDETGPQTGIVPGRMNPVRTMIAVNQPYLRGDPNNFCNSDDMVVMGLQSCTHWDALGHVSYEGRIYNGYPADVVDARGAGRCGIHLVKSLVGRGVLLDVARAKGVDCIEGPYAITREDLEAAEELAKTRVGAGDLVFVRTGQIQHLHAGDRDAYISPAAGPSLQTVEWFHERDIAALGTDSYTGEVFPREVKGTYLPVHLLHIVEMGLTQGQNFDFEALSEDCAEDGRYAFFVEASPLPFTRGVGSPVQPVAIK